MVERICWQTVFLFGRRVVVLLSYYHLDGNRPSMVHQHRLIRWELQAEQMAAAPFPHRMNPDQTL